MDPEENVGVLEVAAEPLEERHNASGTHTPISSNHTKSQKRNHSKSQKRYHKKPQKRNSRGQVIAAGVKVFAATALLLMAFVLARSIVTGRFGKKPVSLRGDALLEDWVEGVWNEHTDPPLAEILPGVEGRDELRTLSKRLWEEWKKEKDPLKGEQILFLLFTAVDALRGLAEEAERRKK